MKTTDKVDKCVIKGLTAVVLSEILKKKKEPFFKGYRPKYYFEIKPIRFGDKND